MLREPVWFFPIFLRIRKNRGNKNYTKKYKSYHIKK